MVDKKFLSFPPFLSVCHIAFLRDYTLLLNRLMLMIPPAVGSPEAGTTACLVIISLGFFTVIFPLQTSSLTSLHPVTIDATAISYFAARFATPS